MVKRRIIPVIFFTHRFPDAGIITITDGKTTGNEGVRQKTGDFAVVFNRLTTAVSA